MELIGDDGASRNQTEVTNADAERKNESADHSGSEPQAIRIAVATRGGGKVNVHFGHASEFWVYDVSGRATTFLEVRQVQAYCTGRADNGEPVDKKKIFDDTAALFADCQAILCSGIGDSPRSKLLQRGIAAISGKGDIEELLPECAEFYAGLSLTK
ncbi:nitrogen fixation protein NifB [Paenibacillus forsythiae]|uniref:Nitrogen fixation protein NifB n=1 Tax=Paenibacillus forsythiae TaxID=365616 RepID=A0ABU3HAW8_9BACL|nr:NifB/NifX family molybdenum-iron cluster-binding protein [Paenibacillus forsythiae]MDT3427959.1 nitrogen fixation protein NifB [Paenibacillus forsythiae]